MPDERDPVRRAHVPIHDGQTLSVFDHGRVIRLIGDGIFLQLDEAQRALLVAAILPPGSVVVSAADLAALRAFVAAFDAWEGTQPGEPYYGALIDRWALVKQARAALDAAPEQSE